MASSNLKTDSIDEVILRLLRLEPGTELDYQTYFDKLKTKIMLANSVKQTLPAEENELLRNELLRVRKIKDKGIRFKVKKVKVSGKSTVPSSQSASQKSGAGRSSVTSSSIVKYKGGDLVPYQKEKPTEEKKDKKSLFTDINKTLGSILKTLSSKFKFDQKQADQERKNQETEKRSARESALEGFSRGVGAIVATTQKMLSPFNDIIEKIKRFLFFTLLGKAFTMFMDWLSNKENQKKFNTFVEFLTKHWPALAGLYILFGTSFGKLVRGLIAGAIRLSFALLKGIPKLVGIIRKNKALSRIIIMSLPLVTGGLKDMLSGKVKETKETLALTDANPDLEDTKKTIDKLQGSQGTQLSPGSPSPKSSPPASGGASPSVPKYNFGGVIPKFAMGGMNNFNPFAMGMAGDFSSGIPIRGAGQDDTLIAAKSGEAILTQKDQSDLSNRFVDRNTGEPLHIPSYLSGRKPGYVSMNNIRPVGGFGGGFTKGGIIQKFNSGGIIGGAPTLAAPNINLNPNLSANLNTPGVSITKMQGGGLFSGISGMISGASNLLRQIPSPGFPGFGNSPTQRSSGRGQGSSSFIGPIPTPAHHHPEVKALLSTIRSAEHYGGTKNPYDVLYGGGTAPITKMTVGEVIQMYDTRRLPKRLGGTPVKYGSGSGAVGAYQFMPFTLEDLIRRGEVKPHQIMTPDLQDRLGWVLARNRGVSIQSLRKNGMTQSVLDLIAPEWASLPYSPSGGSSFYGQPVKSVDFLNSIYKQELRGKDRGLGSGRISGKKGGGSIGLVKENTGLNIPGGTADRQLTALQPGEFVLPEGTVGHLGVPLIERLVAMTDKNSEAFLKRSSLNIPEITPPRSGRSGGFMNLPPIDMSSAGGPMRARASGYAGGSSVPSFSAVSPFNDRQQNAKVFYGIG